MTALEYNELQQQAQRTIRSLERKRGKRKENLEMLNNLTNGYIAARHEGRGKSKKEIYREVCANILNQNCDSFSIQQCQNAMKGHYINIYDYVAGNYTKVYTSKTKLLHRCRKIGFYPRENAKAEYLQILLEFLF